MTDKLPQSEAAKDILAELNAMSFDEIMALPVSDEAKNINKALLEMSECILDCDTQYEAGVFRIFEVKKDIYIHEAGVFRIFEGKKNIYIHDDADNLNTTLPINSGYTASYEVTSWQLMQIAV